MTVLLPVAGWEFPNPNPDPHPPDRGAGDDLIDRGP
jgi:hypothetical protein